ncbi:MAG: CBS domain-containing protein [Planctomycetales bacterium]
MSIKINMQSDTVEIAKADESVVVSRDVTVREVFGLLHKHQVGNVLVCEDDKLVGIFTERDVVKLMAEDADLDVPIESVMVATPMTIPQGTLLAEAIRIMATGGYRRLPIVDTDGQLVGIIKVSGILHYLVDHFPETIFNLPPEPDVVMPEREGA